MRNIQLLHVTPFVLALAVGLTSGPANKGHADDSLTIALSGQSNAVGLQPFLRRWDRVVGYAVSLTPIACWDWRAPCRILLDDDLQRGLLTHDGAASPGALAGYTPASVNAFVWWQGENDIATSDYYDRFDDLVRHVRMLAGNPSLLIVVMQLGRAYSTGAPYPNGATSAAEAQRWVGDDLHAIFIRTQDLPFQPDGTHLTPAGYSRAARRIDAAIRSRLRRSP